MGVNPILGDGAGKVERVLEKVLIVEDEAHARTGLTELVAAWGFRAEGAADGVDGLERIRQWSPGIVVTDLKMPRMDGMELLARVRDLPEKPVVIMLTAQGSIESAVEAMRMGAYDYIPKPIDLKGLLDMGKLIEAFWIRLVVLPDEVRSWPRPPVSQRIS